MSRGKPNKRYTPEFKKMVVETMEKEHLSIYATMQEFGINDHKIIERWERIYLEEGPEGLTVERRAAAALVGQRSCQRGRRRSAGRSAATACGERLPKKFASLGFGRRATPAQKTLVVQKLRQKHSLDILLSIAQLPRATFYYHLKRMNRADKYKAVKAEITAIYHENKGRYGYRRITAELHKRNFLLNHKTVQRLMKELGLVCRVRMKKYRSYKGEVGKIAPNLLNRDFRAEKPNQKWVTDVTEFSLFGELYLSPILDLCSSDLVSYTISDRPVLSMVTTMLDKAFEKIPDGTGLILHSDQGWQYQHKQYQRMLQKKGVQQSMSRKGNCLDNAVIENFFGLLKVNCCTYKSFSPWNTSSRNSLNIWITTTTAESRQS
ncbi:MAG: IS3 family transposase [Subdoligranulum sp.]|nr:IS3 family transposase [Subdoligranulum sp.]